KIFAHRVVPKPNHFDAKISEKCIPLLVCGFPVGMSMFPAIQFDRQTGFSAVEVQVVRAHRMLPAEFASCDLAISQPAPKEFFGPRGFLAKCSGAPDWRTRCPLTLILSPDGGEEIVRWLVCDCGAADWRGALSLSPSEGERIKVRGSLSSERVPFSLHGGKSGKMRFASKASF